MSKAVRLRKGLDIKLIGEADKVKADVDVPAMVAFPESPPHLFRPATVADSCTGFVSHDELGALWS